MLIFDLPFAASPHTLYRTHRQLFRWYSPLHTWTAIDVAKNSISYVPHIQTSSINYVLDAVLPVYLKHHWSLDVARIHPVSSINIFHCCHRTIWLIFHGENIFFTLLWPLPLSALSLTARRATADGSTAALNFHGVPKPGTPWRFSFSKPPKIPG